MGQEKVTEYEQIGQAKHDEEEVEVASAWPPRDIELGAINSSLVLVDDDDDESEDEEDEEQDVQVYARVDLNDDKDGDV